jgi:hypothetical protein
MAVSIIFLKNVRGAANAWRSTALAEMRRGVTGDPGPWASETGIEPRPLRRTVARLRVGVQERWFARLYLTKALVIATLAAFWLVSGGWPSRSASPRRGPSSSNMVCLSGLATGVTVVTALLDIAVGLAVAHRKHGKHGLVAGIVLSLGYLAGAAILAPDLWLDPLGALVKTIPAMVLMVLTVARLEDR